MNPLEKLEADRLRRAQAVRKALDKTVLLKDAADNLSVLGDEVQQDAFVSRLLAHGTVHEAADHHTTLRAPPTQTLVETLQKNRELAHQSAALQRQVAVDAAREEHRRMEQAAEPSRRPGNRMTLEAALREDGRLEQLGTKAVLQEFIAEGRIAPHEQQQHHKHESKQQQVKGAVAGPVARLSASLSATPQTGKTVIDASTMQDVQEGRLDLGTVRHRTKAVVGLHGMKKTQQAAPTTAPVVGAEPSFTLEEAEEEEDLAAEHVGDDWQLQLERALQHEPGATGTVLGSSGRNGPAPPAAAPHHAASVPLKHAATTGQVIKQLREGGPSSLANSPELSALVRLLQLDLPEQVQALHELQQQHAVVATRLDWSKRRPVTYERHPTATAAHHMARGMCKDLAWELVELALQTIDMRPSKEQVAAELHAWKASGSVALQHMARHVADSLLKECVDDIIREVSGEVSQLHRAAASWSAGLLIEAVAGGKLGQEVRQQLRAAEEMEQAAAVAAEHRTAQVAAHRHQAQQVLQSMAREAAPWLASDTANEALPAALLSHPPGDMTAPDPDDVILQGAISSQNHQGSPASFLQPPPGTSQNMSSLHQIPSLNGHARNTAGSLQQSSSLDRDAAMVGMSMTRPRVSTDHDVGHRASGRTSAGTAVNADTSNQQNLPGPVLDVAAAQLPPRVPRQQDTASGLVSLYRGPPGPILPVPGGGGGGGGAIPSVPSSSQRQGNTESQQLYITALRGMLQEMQAMRGTASALSLDMHAAATTAAAGGGAVVHRKCPYAVYPKPEAIKISTLEATFWAKVLVRPMFLGEKAPLIWVDKSHGHITCVAPAPDGTLLAVGTDTGSLHVFDLRCDPGPAWLQVTSSGQTASGQKQQQRHQVVSSVPLVSITWSSDSCQIGCMDTKYRFSMWWATPAPGFQQYTGKQDSVRQPVPPTLAMRLEPKHVAQSGKAALDTHHGVQSAANVPKQVPGHQRPGTGTAAMSRLPVVPCAFHPQFTLLGCQPVVCLPQANGDVVKITSRVCRSPVLPLPPATAATNMMTSSSGSKGATSTATCGRAHTAGNNVPLCSEATAGYLLQPQEVHPGVSAQYLYRGHQAPVVFMCHLSDGASLATLDEQGVFHVWPTKDTDRTGLGWYRPTVTWACPTSIKGYQPRGQPYPIWPQVDPNPHTKKTVVHSTKQSGAFWTTLFGGGGGGGGGSRHELLTAAGLPVVVPSAPVPTHRDYVLDTALHDTPDEVSRLQQDPQGSWLHTARLPWLVKYTWDTQVDKRGRLTRQEIRRPHPSMPSGSPLVISTYLAGGHHQLLSRVKMSAVLARQDCKVVSASLCSGGGDLVVWTRRVSQEAADTNDTSTWSIWTAHFLRLATGRPCTPRIEVLDHSKGTSPPCYAVTPTIGCLGSDYMFVGLSCGVVGCYSVATGQLVRELHLGLPATSSHFAALALFPVAPAWGTCHNAGKYLLAAVPSSSLYVHLFDIDDQVSTLDVVSRRPQPPVVRVLPEPGVPRPPSGGEQQQQQARPAAGTPPGHSPSVVTGTGQVGQQQSSRQSPHVVYDSSGQPVHGLPPALRHADAPSTPPAPSN